MAKTIKFNLNCDMHSIRTLEDLRENFVIEDILFYYHNGLLKRWLDVRGYSAEAKSVSEITSEDDLEIASSIINILRMEKDPAKVAESIASIHLHQEKIALSKQNEDSETSFDRLISTYIKSYQKLVNKLKESSTSIGEIKACITDIADNYYDIFVMDHRNLFWNLQEVAPLAVLCFLMNEKTRKFYISESIENTSNNSTKDTAIAEKIKSVEESIFSIEENLGRYYSVDKDTVKKALKELRVQLVELKSSASHSPASLNSIDQVNMYQRICSMISDTNILGTLIAQGHIIKSTDYEKNSPCLKSWNDEFYGKALIISIGEKDRIRQNRTDKVMTYKDIQNKFVLLDSFEYSPDTETCHVYYMEV